MALLVVLGVLLSSFGVNLLTALAVERLVLRGLPGTRRWLGLAPAGA